MKILKAKVDWHEQFDNPPVLEVWVDAIPRDLVYSHVGNYYYAEKDGYVDFVYEDKADHNGYGGREFKLTMDDGSTITLVGPWSGNALGAQSVGFPLSIPVVLICDSVYSNGYVAKDSRFSGYLSESKFLEAFDYVKDEADLIPITSQLPACENLSIEQNMIIGTRGGRVNDYFIVRKGMTIAQSQAYKKAKRQIEYYQDLKNYLPPYCTSWDNSQKTRQEQTDESTDYINQLIAENDLTKFGINPVERIIVPTDEEFMGHTKKIEQERIEKEAREIQALRDERLTDEEIFGNDEASHNYY